MIDGWKTIFFLKVIFCLISIYIPVSSFIGGLGVRLGWDLIDWVGDGGWRLGGNPTEILPKVSI